MTMTDAAPRERWIWFAVAASLAIAARIVLGVATWQPGWSALTWDDFTRVAIAQEWAADPYFVNGLVWLPLPVWITGSVYAVAGRWFIASPMALMAILNSLAVMAAAAVSAWSAHRMFRDATGTLGVFVLTLFAPWGYFLSLSGLAEPLYFVAITVAVAGLVSWATSDRDVSLAIGSVGVAAAAAMRYEGWWLAAGWALVIGVDTLLLLRTRTFTDVMKARSRTMVAGVAPFGVPVAWMIVNLMLESSPVYFARESARYFANAYGSFERIRDRVFYYPAALLRAAPFLLGAEALAAVLNRKRRPVLLLVGLFASQFVLFYVVSSASGAIGAFPERFLFAYALGLAPLIAGLPRALRGALPARLLRPVGALLIIVMLVGTIVRLQDRPEEWTHAPDLLALNEQLGTVTRDGGSVAVVVGDGTDIDVVPMHVQNGNRVGVLIGDGLPRTPAGASLRTERIPADIVALDLPAEPAIGRFRMSGPLADAMALPLCPGCDGWTWLDESGVERPLGGGPYLGVEFVTDDPRPGQTTAMVKRILRTSETQRGSVDLRWLYGHGFNRGRMVVMVVLDGETVFEADIGDSSRWTEVEFDVPSGEGTSELRVEVVALEGIEYGWGWGRASTVLIRGLVLEGR
jgi:hypothetical protein